MKNKLIYRTLQSCIGIAVLLLFSLSGQAQTITGTLATELFQNTSSTANSIVTYNITLSNGWKAGITTVNVDLKKDGTTLVYSVTGQTTSYATVTPALAPGYYKFTANVSTTNDAGKVVAVAITQEMWVGNRVLWENCFDMEPGISQYSMKRTTASTGQTYSYMQSFNTLATGTAGWVEMSKLSNNINDSHIFWILEAMANPRSFTPTDNITYVEFFYTNATTYGINLRYKQASGTYTTVALSGVAITDKIRFVRSSSNVCTIQKNSANTSIFSLPVNITGDLKITVLGKQLNDQADQIATSYAYPSTSYPMTTTFNATNNTNTGDLTVRIAPLSGFTSPYNYYVSDGPVPSLKDVYKYLKDTLYPGGVDSTTFYRGQVAATNYTSNQLPSGTYYASAFDSKGVRIYSNACDLVPTLTFDDASQVSTSYNEFISTSDDSYATMSAYVTQQQSGSLIYYLTNTTDEHTFGVLEQSGRIGGGRNSYTNLKYGFYVSGSRLYTVTDGVLSATYATAKTGVPLELAFDNGTVSMKIDGSVFTTATLADVFAYKSGIYLKKWGVRLRVTFINLIFRPYSIATPVTDNACGKNSGDLTVTLTGFHGAALSLINLQLKNITDETAPVTVSTITTASNSFSDLAPGVYSLEGSMKVGTITYNNIKQLIYIGSRLSWDTYSNIVTWPNGGSSTHYAMSTASTTVTNPGKAIAASKLAPQTAGWMVFKAVTPTGINLFNLVRRTLISFSETPLMGSLNTYDQSMPFILFFCGLPVTTTTTATNPATLQILSGYAPATPVLVARYANGSVKYRQNYSVLRTVSDYSNARWKPAMYTQFANAGITEAYASFQCSSYTPDMYAQLKYEMDGYYHVMKNGDIKFVFDQEYDAANLTFNLYNSDDILIKTQTNFPALATTHGMNYLTIAVRDAYCIGPGFFYLEVINSKNEKTYLRFYNDYTGCIPAQGNDPTQ